MRGRIPDFLADFTYIVHPIDATHMWLESSEKFINDAFGVFGPNNPYEKYSAPPKMDGKKGLVNDNSVRVRDIIGLDSAVIDMLQKGAKVEVFAMSGTEETIGGVRAKWYLVRTPAGKLGWVFGQFLD